MSTVVAPLQDHTDGLYGFAYVTGLNPPLGSGIGENDVDGGHTTLVSPVIDLTPYENPVLAYWRWYANAPASGANPASDWWQVEVSNDGGNTWQYLENTSQQDISWRRKAFRVADVLEPSETFQIRFIASDSTTVGEYLEGGSLVEAAVDDVVLYDLASGQSAGEEAKVQVNAMPNPASGTLLLAGWMPSSTVRVWDVEGREILSRRANGSGQMHLDVSAWPRGLYVASGWDRSLGKSQIKFEVQD
jgi:WD40 repeat protein